MLCVLERCAIVCSVHSSLSCSTGCTSAGEAELAWERGYESQLEQVRRLQAEVERLRTVVSDQFATQVSSACNVQ